MIEQITKKVLSFLETPYNISLIILTLTIYLILSNPYNANMNFDMLKTLFTYKIYFCGAAFLLLISSANNIDLRKEAAHISLLTMILSIVSLILCKSLIVPGIIAMLAMIITIFMFLFSLKKLYLLTK